MTNPSKSDLVALAARLDVCASEPSRTSCQTLREAAQALRHLASQPSLYGAGQRDMREDLADSLMKDEATRLRKLADELDPPAAIAALPADGGEVGSDTTLPGTDDMDARFAWLEAKCADMGYVLVPEPPHSDSPHASEATPSTAGSVREALDLLQLQQIGRARALRLLDQARQKSDPITLAQADAYEKCGNELRAALALSAPVEAPVAVKPLEWRHYPDAFPPMWVSQNAAFGNYSIEEAAGSDSPSYDVLNPTMGLMVNCDGLPEAKAAAQADYEQRIRSALIATPRPLPSVEPTPNERFMPRMLILDDLHAVCVGGRWDGWKFYRHPDGQWVSLEKLKEDRLTLLGGSAR